ncbi:hypothetical protein RJ641_007513, partial [Dillenia turbinata]
MGTWKLLSGVVYIASFPALCIDDLERIFPMFGSGLPRELSILFSTLFLSFLKYSGLSIVVYVAVVLGVVFLIPFVPMSLILSLRHKGVKKDWSLFFNTLFWNLNFWDHVSTLAGEVDPRKPVTGSVVVDQSDCEYGFMADATQMFFGKWLKLSIEIGAVLSAIGLFEAQLSSSAYQFNGVRSKRINTPWLGILISTAMSLGIIATKTVILVSGLMTTGGIIWYFLKRLCKSKNWFIFINEDLDVKASLVHFSEIDVEETLKIRLKVGG